MTGSQTPVYHLEILSWGTGHRSVARPVRGSERTSGNGPLLQGYAGMHEPEEGPDKRRFGLFGP